MKKLRFAIAAATTLAAGAASAQFTGKLVYQIVRPTVVLTMTYYQSGNHVHVEAYSMEVKKGVVDSSTFFPQDTILFDLSKGTETHLQRQTGRAIISLYTMTILEQAAHGQAFSPATVQAAGTDTANGYPCAHFVETYPGGKSFKPSQRDIWVTSSYGTPGIEVMGSYLYYTPGSKRLQELSSAGCTGVVVRTKMTGLGQTAVMNLVSVDTKTPLASLFRVPSYYAIIDNSGYSPSNLGVKAPPVQNKALTPTKQ